MRRIIIPAAILATFWTSFANAQSLQDALGQAMDECAQTYSATTTHVEKIECLNAKMGKVYRDYQFPYMDLVYEFQEEYMEAAADTDAGKSSHEQFLKRISIATELFNATLTARAKEQQRAASEQNERQRKAAIAAAILSGAFRPQAVQPYIMPIAPPPNVTCTSVQAGTITSTNCH